MVSKIAVFGGTGMTGQAVVEYALSKGNAVRLLYRTEDTLPESFKTKVELVQGDVTNLDDVQKTLEGTDAVVVTLGTRNKLEPTKVLSTGLQNIVDAMKQAKLSKISACLSSFLFWEPEKVPAEFVHLNAEHKAMLDILKTSGLEFIAVLPPHIANEPSSQHEILHDKSPGRIIAKPDLAKFFIDSLELPEHYGKVCGIAKVA